MGRAYITQGEEYIYGFAEKTRQKETTGET
jgi:hypothetical protein